MYHFNPCDLSIIFPIFGCQVVREARVVSSTGRLVFTSKVGTGCTATVVDLGNRFRLIVNDVECIDLSIIFPIFGCQVVREARVVSSTGENPCTCTYFKVGQELRMNEVYYILNKALC